MSGVDFHDDEDFIFDLSDDSSSGSGRDVAVIDRERAPAPAIQPPGSDPHRQVVPASPSQLPREPEPDDDDSQFVSDAINALMRQPTDSRIPSRVQPEPPQPQPRHEPEVQPRHQDQQQRQPGGNQQDFSPREQALLRELREERQRRQEYERRFQQPQGPQPQQRDIATELFENPEAVLGAIQQTFAQQVASIRLEHDLDRAEMRHGESFHTAFAAFMQQVGTGQDRRTYERVMTADSPGEEIVRWHREQDLFQRTGGDLSAYEQQLREKIIAELQGQQQDGGQPQPSPRQQAVQDAPRAPNGQFAPRHEVRLPTPTSRLSGSAGTHGNDDIEDGSDDAIFGAAARRRSRNRD